MALAGSQAGNVTSTGVRPQGLAVRQPSAAALIVLLMLGGYVLLKPYYLLPSGMPQIADMLLIAALPFVLTLPRIQPSEDLRRFRIYMMIFCFYGALVNVTWTFVLMDPSMAKDATYFAFNLCLLIICIRIGLLYPHATLLTIAYAIALSAVVQAASIALTYDAVKASRQIASFNNPNQLGYWSLLSLCIFLCIVGRVRMKWYLQAPTALCLVYAATASLSKGAMISVALLFLLRFIKKPKLILIGLFALAPVYLVLDNSLLFDRVAHRMGGIGESRDDTLSARGYFRIVENPQYILLGAGEGALYRFVGPRERLMVADYPEIHSTFGTILFSYGLIGSVTFAAAIWSLYRLSSGGLFLHLLPAFLYGLTHQGLRFSLLWLLLAVIAVAASTSVGNTGSSNATAKTAARRM
jgi:hypothetical protein